MLHLQPEGLVEPDGGELGAAVVDELGAAGEAGQGGDVDDVALLLLDHAGEEGLDRPEVRQGVDLEGQLDLV